MRRLVLSVLGAAVALLAASFVTVSTPAGALGIVDLSASATANPALAVSPPGALVIYTAVFKNEGTVYTVGTFTNASDRGTLVSASVSDITPESCTIPASGAAAPTISCGATLAAGESFQVRVVIQSPTTVGAFITNTSKATATDSLYNTVDTVQDLIVANNTKTLTTQVNASDTAAGSAGFVRPGGTLTYKKHVLTVRAAELGVVAYMSDVPAVQTVHCGSPTTPCQEGLRADFDQNPDFDGLVAIDVDFGFNDPCHGLGNDACHPLFWRKNNAIDATAFEGCPATTPNAPCLERTYKLNNEFHYVVVLDTHDPDVVSPVKSLVQGAAGG
jgi:hypothetical protein